MKERYIHFEVHYYKDMNDYKRPYGTMSLNINCGIVHISFDVKPNDIKDFIVAILTGKELNFKGRCDINAGKLNSQVDKLQEHTIVKIPDHALERFEREDKLKKAFHKFETAFGDRKTTAEEFIKDLKEIYSI